MVFNSTIVREIKDTPVMCHCASLVENQAGRLICVWYEGAYETSPDTVLKISHKESKSSEWGDPRVLFAFPDVPLGNPVLFSFDGAKIFLIFSLLIGKSWKDSFLCISTSDESGTTWSNPSILLPKKGFMGKTKPIKLRSRKIVIPIYNEEEFCPYMIILDGMENLQNQTLVAETMAREIAIQPVVTELEPDRLVMLCRTNKKKIWRSYSYNGGLSWSILSPTRIPNPNSAIDLVQTETGELILAFNNSEANRHSLSVALSMDQGKSWAFLKDVEKGEGEFSYPCLLEDKEKLINLVYTESRYRIKHVQFDIDWLKQQTLKTPLLAAEKIDASS